MSINNTSTKTILILAANPKDTMSLRLDQEVRDISEILQRTRYSDHFTLIQRWAVRPRDVLHAILDLNPQIVHFSGHGGGGKGLVFEDEFGNTKFVDAESLANLFELVAEHVACVVLNACYSEVQAEAIAQYIPYVIGMTQAIGDSAALEFAFGFYDALGAGRGVEFAYKWGCNSIQMAGIQEHSTPVLKKSHKMSTPNDSIISKSNKLTSWQHRQLEQEREGLHQQYDLLNEKLRRLRNTIAIETDEAVCFKLEKQIERIQLECKRLDEQLEIINTKLH